MKKNKSKWVYGQSPTPTNFHEAADIIRGFEKKKPSPKKKDSK